MPVDARNTWDIPLTSVGDSPLRLSLINESWSTILLGWVEAMNSEFVFRENMSADDLFALENVSDMVGRLMGMNEIVPALTILNSALEALGLEVVNGALQISNGNRLQIMTPLNNAALHLFSFSETQQRLYFWGSTFEIMSSDARRKFFVSSSGVVEINNGSSGGNTQLIVRANANVSSLSPLVVHNKQISFEVTENGSVKAYQEIRLWDKTTTNDRQAAKLHADWYDNTDAARKSEVNISLEDSAGTFKVMEGKSNAGDILLGFRDKPPVESATISGNVTDAATLKALMVALDDLGLITDSTTEA